VQQAVVLHATLYLLQQIVWLVLGSKHEDTKELGRNILALGSVAHGLKDRPASAPPSKPVFVT
jgi:hypothetical protein